MHACGRQICRQIHARENAHILWDKGVASENEKCPLFVPCKSFLSVPFSNPTPFLYPNILLFLSRIALPAVFLSLIAHLSSSPRHLKSHPLASPSLSFLLSKCLSFHLSLHRPSFCHCCPHAFFFLHSPRVPIFPSFYPSGSLSLLFSRCCSVSLVYIHFSFPLALPIPLFFISPS